jgi:K+-transporting ATPase ATPase A chain
MFEILLVFGLAILLGFPLGHYLAAVMRGAPMRGDRLFGLVEQPIYKLLGLSVAKGMPSQSMPLKHYVSAFLISNLVIGFIVWLLLMTQAWLPLNPNAAPNMSWDLALHTMVSFLTNTNQQHYSGQAQLSYLAQMTGIVGLQVITPMMGLAMVVATLRALFSKQSNDNEGSSPVLVGNYWADIIRPAVRFFLPLGLVFSVLLNSQGVPATFSGGPVAQPVEASSEFKEQKIPLGPVAPMVAVKQLGTNGGGWYGPNSAVPLENPTPFSNVLEMLAIILIPVSVVFMLGAFTGRKKFAALVFGCMLTMSVISTAVAVWSESFSGVAHSLASMEGKEVRFGSTASALWAAITTQTSNGSVNMMHDSAAPLTGLVTLSNMLINAIWGGIGCGLQQFMVYLMLTVFVAGLMTGRTPELFGRKIEAPEVRLLAVLILLQPIVILGFTAVTLAIPAITGNSNPSFHGISQVFYEYVSAFANNGSGFEGLGDATVWWNVSCSIVLALGRYPALIIPLVIAVMLANKRLVPEGNGSLKVETPTFALTLIAVVVILTLLQFMPVLVLGPIADHLILSAQSALPAA